MPIEIGVDTVSENVEKTPEVVENEPPGWTDEEAQEPELTEATDSDASEVVEDEAEIDAPATASDDPETLVDQYNKLVTVYYEQAAEITRLTAELTAEPAGEEAPEEVVEVVEEEPAPKKKSIKSILKTKTLRELRE